MKTVLYISRAKAMELVHDNSNGNVILFAKAFKAICEEGFQFTLPNGMILMKGINDSKRVRFVITTPD